MIERIEPTTDDRGQVGIGTLIVFIAMVLVAAIAAGVLINTAGFLQSSAEETGQQSSEQVTNRLEIVNTVGTSLNPSADPDTVETLEVTVKQAPGAANIDLGQTVAQYTSDDGAADLTFGDTVASDVNSIESDGSFDGSQSFGVVEIQDVGGDSIDTTNDDPVLNDPADRAKLVFIAGDDDGTNGGNIEDGLQEGETATIQLNTQSGGTTTVTLSVPETLSGSSAVQL
jgi:flagellin FlaB